MGACASCQYADDEAVVTNEVHINEPIVVTEMLNKHVVTKQHPPQLDVDDNEKAINQSMNQSMNLASTISLNNPSAIVIVPIDDCISLSAAPTDSPIAKRVVHVDHIRRSVHEYEPHIPTLRSSRADQHGQTNLVDGDKAMLQQQIKSLNSFKSMSRQKSSSNHEGVQMDRTPSTSASSPPADASPRSVSDVA